MSTGGPDTPLAKAVDKSGFPFQLAVERELRKLGQRLSWEVVPEVPIRDVFADIVLRRPGILAVIECKRVEGETWHFLVPTGASGNVGRCRIEWHNPRAERFPVRALIAGTHLMKVFCSECNMSQGSYEASFCVLPKKSAQDSLETLGHELLGKTHALADVFGLEYGDGPTYVIPVIVTNAGLTVCEYDVESLDIDLGRLGAADFKPVDFVRFRKTLVSRASNDYEWDRVLTLGDWTSDRERTVFVVSPRGLQHFLSGFRAFGPAGGGKYPAEFESPPEYGTGRERE